MAAISAKPNISSTAPKPMADAVALSEPTSPNSA